MVALKQRLQPQAVSFGGCAAMPVNSIAWVGTESGHAPYPLWYSRDVCGMASTGEAMGEKIYMPYEVDCTVQYADSWFYHDKLGYKSIVELAGQYHDSVGHGGNLLLNLAPPPNTSIPAVVMKRYAELGNWTRRCYGEGGIAASGALATTVSPSRNCTSIRLVLPRSPSVAVDAEETRGSVGVVGRAALVDRFLIKEELADGQRIIAFSILADAVVVYNGRCVRRLPGSSLACSLLRRPSPSVACSSS